MTNSTDLYLEFTDAANIIRIEPISLIYPKANLDWDKNWIQAKVTVKAGAFSGEYLAEFLTTDFELFKRQLKTLDNDFNSIVTFEPLEQQLILKIKGDGLGHFEVVCEAKPESHLRQKLTFSISFDQTQIKEYIRQLDKITKAFPIDGDLKTNIE